MKNEEMERKVELMKKRVGDKVFNREDCRGITTIDTLKKYGYVEKVSYEEITEYTIEEAADLLNEMNGEDCYYSCDENWWDEYKVINGKICRVVHISGYKFIK